jgi:hypothetical protein
MVMVEEGIVWINGEIQFVFSNEAEIGVGREYV